MENKYYTPSLEEILHYVSIEKYIWTSDEDPIKFEGDTINILSSFIGVNDILHRGNSQKYSINTELYKIKYLDTTDIEELGFKIISKDEGYNLYKFIKNSLVYTLLDGVENNIHIDMSSVDDANKYIILYNGDCKNKSELKRILTQLNIL